MHNPLKRLARRGPNKSTFRERLTVAKNRLTAAKVRLAPSEPMPVADRVALTNYSTFLFHERRAVCAELYPHMGSKADKIVLGLNEAWKFFFNCGNDWTQRPDFTPASSRALKVLDLVGIDWRRDGSEADLDSTFGSSMRDNGERPGLPREWPAPDAELLELGRRFDALHAEWMATVPAQREAHVRIDAFASEMKNKSGWSAMQVEEAAWSQPGVTAAENAAQSALGSMETVTDLIRATGAHTIAGLAVKARAAIPGVWGSGNYEEDAGLGVDEDWTEKNARDLIDACLSVAGLDWRGERVGPATNLIEKPPEAASPLASDPDLSACSLYELNHLHRAVTQVWMHATAELQSPWCMTGQTVSFNAAGKIREAASQPLDRLIVAIRGEAERRRPANNNDRDERLSLLLRDGVTLGSDLDASLLDEAVAAWGPRPHG